MAFIQGNIAERNLYLSLAGIPALGVLPAHIVCEFRKEGQTGVTVKVLDNTNWFEVGNGFYFIRFNSSDTDTIGVFFYTLTSDYFDNLRYDDFSIEPPSPLAPITPAGFCTVSGNLLTVGNSIPVNTLITFRPAEFPISVNESIVTADKIITYPDITGAFSVNLIQGTTVLVEIERTGIHTQIVVPMTSAANLLDLLPPFPTP